MEPSLRRCNQENASVYNHLVFKSLLYYIWNLKVINLAFHPEYKRIEYLLLAKKWCQERVRQHFFRADSGHIDIMSERIGQHPEISVLSLSRQIFSSFLPMPILYNLLFLFFSIIRCNFFLNEPSRYLFQLARKWIKMLKKYHRFKI